MMNFPMFFRPGAARWRAALTVILVTLMLGLAVSLQPVQAARFSINGQLTNERFALCYAVTLPANADVTFTMYATSGDLLPFIGLRAANSTDILSRGVADPTGQRATLTYKAKAATAAELLATRADVEEGKTQGEFLIIVEGSDAVSVASTVTEPCKGGDGFVSTDAAAELPRPKNGQPAVLLPIGVTVSGVVNDQSFRVNYLIDGRIKKRYVITLWRPEGSQLDPFMGVLDYDKEENVLYRSVPLSADAAQITFTPPADAKPWYILAVSRVDVETGTTSGIYKLRVDLQ